MVKLCGTPLKLFENFEFKFNCSKTNSSDLSKKSKQVVEVHANQANIDNSVIVCPANGDLNINLAPKTSSWIEKKQVIDDVIRHFGNFF